MSGLETEISWLFASSLRPFLVSCVQFASSFRSMDQLGPIVSVPAEIEIKTLWSPLWRLAGEAVGFEQEWFAAPLAIKLANAHVAVFSSLSPSQPLTRSLDLKDLDHGAGSNRGVTWHG